MTLLKLLILAIIQGLAELLPISSSAHVVVAEKLMHLDPTTPEMTFLLVMLHTGTMFAVIVYFWNAWKRSFFSSREVFKRQAARLIWACILTAIVGLPLIFGIEHFAATLGYVGRDTAGHLQKAQIEDLFGNLALVSIALAAVGIFIIIAGLWNTKRKDKEISLHDAGWIGAIQGLCLPFRGFSRSGATISVGLVLGDAKTRVEEFSFALAVILTPAAIGRELWRLLRHTPANPGVPVATAPHLLPLVMPGILGLIFSFAAGVLALKLLSQVLERGRWHWFGFYCVCAAILVFALHLKGF